MYSKIIKHFWNEMLTGLQRSPQATLVRHGRLRLWPVQWWAASTWCQKTGNWTGDHSSPVGSARSGLVSISSSPARSSPRHTGNGSHALHRCVQLGMGSPTRLTLDTGTVVSISKIVAHKRFWDAGRHQHSERLPTSSEVQSGGTDVRQCRHGCLHQEWRGHTIQHSHATDNTPAEVVRLQGDQAGASPSTRSVQQKHVTTGCQSYMRGDFVGHPIGNGTFTGSCRNDVKIPTSVIATSVWIASRKISPFL